MNIISRLFSKTINPLETSTKTILPELKQLKEDIVSAMTMRDPLSGLVAFFNATSPWHDKPSMTNHGDESPLALKLNKFERLIANSGRCSIGWNRTERGQLVTDDNVWLGGEDYYDLFTKTITFWRSRKDAPKGGWGFSGMENLNAYDVISDQARVFIENGAPIIDAINEIESAVS